MTSNTPVTVNIVTSYYILATCVPNYNNIELLINNSLLIIISHELSLCEYRCCSVSE